jgi:hypothetical protein
MSKANDVIAALGAFTLGVVASALIIHVPPPVEAQINQQTVPCRINSGLGSTAVATHASCRNVQASLRGLRFVNVSSNLAYLKLYNLRSDPVCSSADGLQEIIPIPYNAQGGGIVDQVTNFLYSQGIGYCLVGGSGATNASPPPAGVYGVIAIGG